MNRVTLFLIVILSLWSNAASAHPAEDFNAFELPAYERLMGDSSWNNGEIKFYGASERAPYASLSNLEKYMIAGAVDPVSGTAYTPWQRQILTTALEYTRKFGEVPAELNITTLQELSGNDQIDPAIMAVMNNPLQDRPVRLDAVGFSSGDLFVKELTKEEIIYLSFISPYYKKIFGLNIDANPDMGGQQTEMPEMFGPALYYRLYGESGVLLSGVFYQRMVQ
ncbi:MAG: hypothetical protein R3F46_06675 [bacterium]